MIVCVCNAIRENEVREAARNGASCPASAYAAVGRRPRCGQCFSFAREIIAAERATA
jgi:bacterioferritin-associated ferredoxin